MLRLLLLLIGLQQLVFADLHVQTTQKQTTMIELYSSEGCSSCPPAEGWVNNLTKHPKLWSEFVPLVFHVDYWDNLGWKDVYAKYPYSQRQRAYASQGHTSGVYTPGVFLNSREWRGLFSADRLKPSEAKAPVLTLDVSSDTVSVHFPFPDTYRIHIALLGFGLETRVPKGENRGKTLKHDFVVLTHKEYLSNTSTFTTTLPNSDIKAEQYAIAVWITKPNSLQVLQSTGGWL